MQECSNGVEQLQYGWLLCAVWGVGLCCCVGRAWRRAWHGAGRGMAQGVAQGKHSDVEHLL